MISEPSVLIRLRLEQLVRPLKEDISSLPELGKAASKVLDWVAFTNRYIAEKTSKSQFINTDNIIESFFHMKNKFNLLADKIEEINGFSAFKNELEKCSYKLKMLYNGSSSLVIEDLSSDQEILEPSFSQDEIVTKAESFLSKVLKKDSETKLVSLLKKKYII